MTKGPSTWIIIFCLSLSVPGLAQKSAPPSGLKATNLSNPPAVDSCRSLRSTLEADYRVTLVEIAVIGTIDVETDRHTPDGLQWLRSWHTNLIPKFDHRRVKFDIFFPYSDGGVRDTADVLNRLRKYYQIVVAVRWIDSLLTHDSSVTVSIKYIGGRSLSYHALTSFVVSLSRHTWKADEWIGEILPIADRIAFLDLQERRGRYSRWIVFPDGRTMLWHYSDAGVLDLDLEPFRASEMWGQNQVFVTFSPDLQVVDAP
jgi:hypothetical protein